MRRLARMLLLASVTASLHTTLASGPAMGQCAFDWRPGEAVCGTDGKVWASTVWDPDGLGPQPPLLVVGGSFSVTGDIFANHIATWNGASWGTLGSGMNGATVYALAVYDGELIAAGDFTIAGGVSANGIARWNGTSWQPLGTGIGGGIVKALEVYGNELIAGGNFTSADGMPTDRIARWDGNSWQSVGLGVGGVQFPDVKALVTYNGELIVGGHFANAGGVSTNSIVRWNGVSWLAFPTGGTDVNANQGVMALTVYAGELIAGGDFSHIGGVAGNTLARWNGSDWQSLIPTGQSIYAGTLRVYNNELIVAGGFQQVGDGVSANNIARWNGTIWQALDTGVNTEVATLAIYNGELIAGGAFTVTVPGGVALNRIARWDGASWQALNLGIENKVNALGVYGGALIAGGDFIAIGDVAQAHGIARWNGVSWNNLGSGMNNSVNAVTVYGNELIAGGSFTAAGGTSVGRIARWNGSFWQDVGGGVLFGPTPSATVIYALRVYNNELIATGYFNLAGGTPANSVARWNGSTWQALDMGLTGPIRALAVYNNELFAGGEFETIPGGGTANNIALWNGTNWQSLNGGVSGFAVSVKALCVYGGELIVGGTIQGAGGLTNIGNIARWNGVSWQRMGSGVNNTVRALTVYDGELFAGGDFTTAGGVAADHIARWDGSSWQALNSGVNKFVEAFTVYNNELIAGGAFYVAGGNISGGWARWGSTGAYLDCNANEVLDDCDLDDETSLDCNGNAIPDECEQAGTVDSRWIPTTNPQNWSVAANWCQPLVPNNGTPPGNTYSVTILGTSPTCTLDINPTISALTIEQNGVLEVNSGSEATVRTLIVEPPTPTISNAGTLRAKDAKRFLLDAADIIQAPTGVIEAIGQPGQVSKVQINGRRVLGGTARTSGDSAVIELLGGAILDSVTVEGNVISTAATVNVPSGQTGVVAQMINNQGLITVAQANSISATFLSPADLGASFSGPGCVSMLSRFARLGEFKGFVVNGAGHCVEGAGRIFGAFTNASGATVTANNATEALKISAPGPKTSDGTLQAIAGGTLSIEDDISGTGQYLASGGMIIVPGDEATLVLGASLDVLSGGTATAAGDAYWVITGSALIDCGPGLLRGCSPPVLVISDYAVLTIGENMTMRGSVDVLVGPQGRVELAGDFDNQCDNATTFHWENGPLMLNGSDLQSFELAGQDLGDANPAAFIDNFAMGTIHVEPGRTVEFSDNFDNTPGPGCEVLYVGTLILGAGSTTILNDCNVYYRQLIQEPGATVMQGTGRLLSALVGDMNCDGGIDGGDIQALLAALIDPASYDASYPECSMNHADLNQSGTVDLNDVPAFVDYLLQG